MNCPNINIKEVRNEFNSIVEAFGGRPLAIDEFKSKDLRNKRTGVDDNAMQVAYFLWDKTNGDGLAALPEYVNSNISDEYTRIRAVVNELLGVETHQSPHATAQYQLHGESENDEYIASERTIRDLAARMSDRIGIPVKFESNRADKYKGKLEDGTAVINLAYATLDTPIHEILGHPIIRAIKGDTQIALDPDDSRLIEDLGYYDSGKYDSEGYPIYNKNIHKLYQNLLKELEYGRGKEVLDRIKRDYEHKHKILHSTEQAQIVKKQENETDQQAIVRIFGGVDEALSGKEVEIDGSVYMYSRRYGLQKKENYTLEEQQEEAIVELLGLYTADRLDKVKDGKLISLLKRLLKEIKSFVRSLLTQREVEIDKLPDNMTLGDIADLLAYSNSKLILPGNEVIYTTPDNRQFKTYAEASKHIGDLAKSVEDVDLSSVKIEKKSVIGQIDPITNKRIKNAKFIEGTGPEWSPDDNVAFPGEPDIFELQFDDGSRNIVYDEDLFRNYDEEVNQFYGQIRPSKYAIENFIRKNKEYEQSKEIIEEWKKVNNIQYNPEEVYSRGQEFVSVVGAYSSFDVNLMMQNLLQHIEDNEKAGGKFAISAFTKPIDRTIPHLEARGGKIKFKIYPKSEDILWAANTDVFSGSVWDASEKVNKDKKSELLGVSYTKYPSLGTISGVQPNLASIIDSLSDHHNELGITLTGNNFRLEYDEDIPYSAKKIIDGVNSILDQKYGRLDKADIKRPIEKRRKTYSVYYKGNNNEQFRANSKEEALQFIDKHSKNWEKDASEYYLKDSYVIEGYEGIQPTQTDETLKESIDSVKNKVIQDLRLTKNGDFWVVIDESTRKIRISTENKQEAEDYINQFPKTEEKEYTSQALINTKISKLKEVAKKYPRTLIRSEVVQIGSGASDSSVFDYDDIIPFQKVSSEMRAPKYYSSNDIYEKNYTRLKYIGRALTNKIKNNGWVNLARVKKLNDIYTKNENSPFMVDIIDYDDYKTTNEKLRKVQIIPKQSFLEKLRSDAEVEFEQYLNNNEWVREFIYGPNEDLFSSEQKRSIVDNKHAEVQKKSPNKGVQLNLFDEIVDSQGKARNKMNRESVELVYRLAKRLSRLTGITFSVVTMDEAVAIRNAKNGTNLTADDARGRGFGGFYDMGTKTAYLVDERMESHITVHEVFGHPILQALRMNPKTHEAYNKLILEAAKYSDEIEDVYKIYGKNYKSGLAIEDEMIIRVLELHVNNKLGGSKLLGVAREIMREITSFLIDVLNLIPGVEIMRPDLTIERLAEYALYGRGKLGLFDGDPRIEADKAAKRLAKKLNANTFNKLSYGFIKINDILELSNAYALDAVKEWAEENQTSTAEKVIAGIQAELLAVDYESGKIYDYNGSEVASFASSRDGAYTYISNIDTGKLGWDVVLRTIIARSDTLFPSTIRISSSSIPVLDGLVNGDVVFQSAIEHSIAKGIIPKSAVSSVNHNGADYVEIDTLFAKNNEFEYLYAESKVSSQTANAHTPSEFINTIIDGLSAQIANLERKPTNRIESIERLKDLVDQINSATHVQAAEIFINYASAQNGPVMSVSRKVRELVKQMAKNELIDNSVIRDMESNFLTLYKNAIKNIGAINSDPYSILNVLPDKSREILSSQIQSIEQELSSIENSLRNLKTYAYKNQLAIEGAKVGSTTIGDRLSGNILIEDEDISGLSSLLFGMAFSNKEQMRALHKIVLDVQADVHRRVETDGVLNNLKEKWDAVRSGKPFSTYERFYEKNKLGKATGYLISDLLYGQFNRDYDLFKQKLAKKYKLNSPNDIPTNKKERIKYLSEKDEWLNSHAERMFTPEYYKLRNSLSEDARQALDDAGMAIRMFLNKFKDADGFIDTSLMSPQDLEKFRSLKKAKQNLSNIRYADGSAKSGIALDIANEVSAYNKKISEGLKYKPNYSLFEKKMAEMKSKLSAAEFVKWKSVNTRITYKQEFWDSLDSNAKDGQSKEWQDMYDARASILRIYRNLDSIDVSAARLDSNKTARETVEFFDKKLAETRTKTNGKSNFSEIAEIVPTDEYLFEEEKARNNPNKAAWAEFIRKTHFVGPGGKLTKYSQWTKIQPKDKSMVVTEPSSIWSELDKTSAFYNQNYDESRSEDGLQPRRDLYDNSKEFNKIKKDKADYEFYSAILDAYRKANSMYSYNPNMSPLRLAQITGPFLHKLTHGDSKLKAILGTLKDKFVIRAYEPGYGDTESRGMFRADGSPVMFVPTKYRTMLDQPDQISRDLLGSFALYYSAALNHNLMTNRVDDIETILQGIHDTRIKSKNASKRNRDNDESETRKEGATRMYKRSYDFVKSSVYGYELGRPYNIPLWKDKDGRRIYVSLAKPIKDFLNYARKTNLAGNVVAIFSNFMTAGISSKIEAACGTHMDSKTYSAAGFEVAKNMPDIMATSTFDRGSNKIIALMRYMNVVRSNENDMKGLHGSKLINTISSNIWYGPYTAGDFAVKSRMMVAVMMNYKLYDGSYYSKEMFLSKFYPDNRADGEKMFDSISDTLYDAFEINKDGVLAVKSKFKDYVTDDTLSNVYSLLGVLGRKLDGTLTGSERSRIHSDAFASAILLHRGWLVNALQERFSPEVYSYEKQMMVSGQYKGENFSAASKIIWKFLANKISDIERDGLKGNLNFKLGSMKNEFSGSQLYNARRIIGEVGSLVILSAITALLSSLVPRNAFGDKDEESAEMWAYVLSLRVAMEMFAVYSPADVYNIIGSPTAAEGTIENFKGIFEMFADGSYDELVQSGKYRNRTKLERAAIKLTPGYKQIYERAIHPDLGATERFLIGNIPTGPITIASKVFDRRTEQEKRIEERKKQAARMRKEFEEKNADKIKEMKKRKREQFNRRPLFGE